MFPTHASNTRSTSRKSVLLLGAATVAMALAFTSTTGAQEATPKTDRTAVTSSTATSTEWQGKLLIGDKLQVSFFEHLDLGQGEASMSGMTRTFYQRLDLTGEHVVDVDGTLTFPLVGRFNVAGMTPEEAESAIAEAYQRELNGEGEVHIAIIERKPVFVTGHVRNAGSFAYQPGMVALQAVSLAGGYDEAAQAAARVVDMTRERERLEQASQRMARLGVRRERLLLERELTDGDARSDKRSFAPAQTGAPESAVQAEARVFAAQAAAQEAQTRLLDVQLTGAKGEMDAMRNQSDLVEKQIDVRSERLRVLQQMQGRGLASIELLWNAQRDVADFEMRREQLVGSITVAQRQMAEIEAQHARSGTDKRLSIERELQAVEDELAQLNETQRAAREVLSALEQLAASYGLMPGDDVQLRILRRGLSGTVTVQADETSDLQPGDVLRVERARQPALTGAVSSL